MNDFPSAPETPASWRQGLFTEEASLKERESLLKILQDHRKVRQDYKGARPVLSEEKEKALEEFTKHFIDLAHSASRKLAEAPFAQHLQKPDTFHTSRERFKIRPLIGRNPFGYTSAYSYGQRGSFDAVDTQHYLDSPFAYALEYLTNAGQWEIIGLTSFFPDFEKNEMRVDQIQGGPTKKTDATPEGRRARLKFDVAPNVPLEVARLLAQRVGMKRFGILKRQFNAYPEVSESPTATLYETIAKQRGMIDPGDSSPYVYEAL